LTLSPSCASSIIHACVLLVCFPELWCAVPIILTLSSAFPRCQFSLSRSQSDGSSQDLRDSSRSLKATRLSNGNSTFDSHRIFPHSPFHSPPPFDALLRSSSAHKSIHALVVNQKVRGRLGVRRIPLPENSPFLSPFLPSLSPMSKSSSPSALGDCVVCGQKTATRCGPCAASGTDFMFFCSREHQKMVSLANALSRTRG